jgi:hypothetical protein
VIWLVESTLLFFLMGKSAASPQFALTLLKDKRTFSEEFTVNRFVVIGLRVLKVKNVPGRDKLLILQYQKIRK